jgi:hypothetical protein
MSDARSGNRPPPPPAVPYGAPQAASPPGPSQPLDPYAADRALAEWAAARGLSLSGSPDLAWYQAWGPFIYLPPIARVGRELTGKLDDANGALIEAFDPDPIKQATGEDRLVVAFVMSERLRARAALRAKSGGGLVSDVTSGIGSLLSGKSAGSVLGDPTLEQRFDVTVPSREEGNVALPVALRQLLFQYQWRGLLEVRAGGLICAAFDCRSFEPAGLDRFLGMFAAIYRAAVGAA